MPLQAVSYYERLLDEHQWLRSGFHWTVVNTGPPSPLITEIGAKLSRSTSPGIEQEVNVAVGADLFPKRSVVSVDRQREGYFLFQAVEGEIDDPGVLRKLTEQDGRAWSIASIMYGHKLTYAVDGEIRLTWPEIPYGNRPVAGDQLDEDILFVQEACQEEGISFGLAALMAVVDLGSGVRMDINWPHAPRPAIILGDPIWW
jgi:hypothetical protein